MQSQSTANTNSSGWGADRRPEDRPGVPKEAKPPHRLGNATWSAPEQQVTPRSSLIDPMRQLTPVYASACPPRGVSGAIRRAAYRLPDYNANRWLLLMLADRIDVVEHNPMALFLLGGLGAAGLMWLAGRGSSRSRARPPRLRGPELREGREQLDELRAYSY